MVIVFLDNDAHAGWSLMANEKDTKVTVYEDKG
jgi:hypothetical protein